MGLHSLGRTVGLFQTQTKLCLMWSTGTWALSVVEADQEARSAISDLHTGPFVSVVCLIHCSIHGTGLKDNPVLAFQQMEFCRWQLLLDEG